MRTIAEEVRIDSAIAPADIHGASPTGTWFEMQNYRRVEAIVTASALTVGKNITVQLMQAKDNAGTGSKVLGDPVSVVGTGAAVLLTAEAQVTDMDDNNGFGYVTAQVTCDDTVAVYGAALLVRGDSRFGTDVA